MSVSTLLVNTCGLTPPSESQSANSGGMVWEPGTSVTPVACNIQTTSGREFIEAGQETGERFFDCYFLSSQTITTGYRISGITTGGIAGALSGVTLEVISPPQDQSGRGAYHMVVAKEVTG